MSGVKRDRNEWTIRFQRGGHGHIYWCPMVSVPEFGSNLKIADRHIGISCGLVAVHVLVYIVPGL